MVGTVVVGNTCLCGMVFATMDPGGHPSGKKSLELAYSQSNWVIDFSHYI